MIFIGMLNSHVLEGIHIAIIHVDVCPGREVDGVLFAVLPLAYG